MKISITQGISSSFCTCKILMEDDTKPKVQSQRRLNPNMKEVAKAEVMKLLDAKVILAKAEVMKLLDAKVIYPI